MMDDVSCVHQQQLAEKLKLRLASPSYKQGGRLAFLAFSGSFNPVHSQHIRALNLARTALESSGWAVPGGFLAPSSDDYISDKLRQAVLSLDRRTKLCELATEESDWLSVIPWGEFSSFKLCKRLRRQLEHDCAALLKGRTLTGIEVMGSDAAIRIFNRVWAQWRTADEKDRTPWFRDRIVCCLLRPGPSSTDDLDNLRRIIVPQAADVGVEIIVVDTTRQDVRLEEVSSTEIRKLLDRSAWDDLKNRRWLHPNVLRTLKQWALSPDD
jgi:nicotinic acid mononucleotide adenylyltransferase